MTAAPMPADGWSEADGSHRRGDYVIFPDSEAGRGWIVQVQHRFPRVPWRIGPQPHSRLSGAKAWAMHHHRLVVRRIKLIRHTVLTVVLMLLGVALVQYVPHAGGRNSLVVFVLALAAFGVGLREFVGLVNHALGDTDYFEMGDDTAVDRAVVESVGKLRTPIEEAANSDDRVTVIGV